MAGKKSKDAELEKVIADLTAFNAKGLAAIATLGAMAAELTRRVEALEVFRKALETPGDKEGAN